MENKNNMTKQELWNLIIQEGNNKTFLYHGLKCEIHRVSDMGHLCGYVTIPDNYFKTPKSSVVSTYEEDDIEYDDSYWYDVHGGITWSSGGKIGFDCAHMGDLIPCYILDEHSKLSHYMIKHRVYRDMAYVEFETKRLADQIFFANIRHIRELKNK